MALAPCMIHGERFRGKGANLYIRWAHNGVWHRRRVTGCPDHVDQSFGELLGNAVAQHDVTQPDSCASCGSDMLGDYPTTFYYSVYLPGEQRRDFFPSLCENCARRHASYVDSVSSELPERETEARGALVASYPWFRLAGVEPPDALKMA